MRQEDNRYYRRRYSTREPQPDYRYPPSFVEIYDAAPSEPDESTCNFEFFRAREPPPQMRRKRVYYPDEVDDCQCPCCGCYHENSYTPPCCPYNFNPLPEMPTESSYCSCACSCERVCSICGNWTVCCARDDESEASSTLKSRQTEFIDLPYQKTDAFQMVLQELEMKIDKRNKEKFMRQNGCENCICNNCWQLGRNCCCCSRN